VHSGSSVHISGTDTHPSKYRRNLQVFPHFDVGPKISVLRISNDAYSLVTLLTASHLSLISCIYSNARDVRVAKRIYKTHFVLHRIKKDFKNFVSLNFMKNS